MGKFQTKAAGNKSAMIWHSDGIYRRKDSIAFLAVRRIFHPAVSSSDLKAGFIRASDGILGLTFIQFPRQRVADALNQDNEQHEDSDDENDDFGLVAVVAVADGEVAQAAAAYHTRRRAV